MTNRSAVKHLTKAAALIGILSQPISAAAQDEDDALRRTRVALGPQIVPSYPGSNNSVIRPLVDVSRTRGDDQFAFEAPDESFGFRVYQANGFSFGPSVGLEGKRASGDVGGTLPKVNFTVELGAFAQYEAGEQFRLRTEMRRGVNGHDGIISVLSADYVMRDGDKHLVSIGPRVTITDKNYQNAYFGVAAVGASPSGIPAYRLGGGVQAVGGTLGYIQQLTPRWGFYSYAKYDRLIGDAAASPLVRQFGSRDQVSGGLALTYTFGDGVR